MKIVAIVQARMNSTRLPGKILMPLGSSTVLGYCLTRLKASKKIDQVVVATTVDESDNETSDYVHSFGIECFRGSSANVLERYYLAAKKQAADIVIRITADCPLIDPGLLDESIEFFLNNDLDYFSNQDPIRFPDGLDIDIFKFNVLEETYNVAFTDFDLEHVTPFMKEIKTYRTKSLSVDFNFGNLRWTVDEPEDLVVVNEIVNQFGENLLFSWKEALEIVKLDPKKFSLNENIPRNEGSRMSNSEKLRRRENKGYIDVKNYNKPNRES